MTVELDDFRKTYRYVRESLLHYARWMAENERIYLDYPDELEYPTETWAAQELRKGTVLLTAAEHAEDAEATRFRDRAGAILDGAWQRLMSFETRNTTRPLALVLQQGYLETFFQSFDPNPIWKYPSPAELDSDGPFDPEMPCEFTPQKQCVRNALRSPGGLATMLARFVTPAGWKNAIRRSWAAERLRQIGGFRWR